MSKIQNITAQEILDSRGNPTVMVSLALNNGITASACVPSGASTGMREAVELRDGDARRYGGKGVLNAMANVNKIIAPKLKGKSPHAQKEIDYLMRKLDGTETKFDGRLPRRRAGFKTSALWLHPQAAWRQSRCAIRFARSDDERGQRRRALDQ